MDDILSVTTLLDDAFRAAFDGEVLNLADGPWQIGIDGVQMGHRRFWVQLTAAHWMSRWSFTVLMPPFADRLWLVAIVATFLRHPDQQHEDVVNAIRTDARQLGE